MSSERVRVAVTGLGTVSPIGNDVASTWDAALAGRSGVGPITQFDAGEMRTKIAAEVKGFHAEQYLDRREARRTDPFLHFAVAAARQAVDDSGLDLAAVDPFRVGVLVGTTVGGMHVLVEQLDNLNARGPRRVSPFTIMGLMGNSATGYINIMLGARGPSMTISTACATGSHCLGEATAMIRRGVADVMVAGASEAAIMPLTIATFDNMGALASAEDPARASRPFDAGRTGFVVGEGAAVVVLERLERALARGARIYGELAGYAATDDAFHLAQPIEDGSGAAAAMRNALADAGLMPEDVDYINAHGTGTPIGDIVETRAIKSVFGRHARSLAVSSTKSVTGHMLAAAGALEAIFCLLAMRDGVLPPTANLDTPDPDCDLDYVPNRARPADVRVALSNSFGLGGHNSSLVFRRVA